MTKYAELTLYMGLCNSMGFGEGRFDRDDQRTLELKMQIMPYIQQEIEAEAKGTGLMRYGYFDFVRNEAEAQKLIAWMSKQITGVSERIQLLDSMHGKIRFFRIARVDGMTQKDTNKLKKIVDDSGVGPKFSARKYYDTTELWRLGLKFH